MIDRSPRVSVLIPTYNYAHFLDEAIQSVLDQTYTDYELIIVDNCSTDSTDEVVEKYLRDTRVHYHKNERNLGLSGNWNRCLELARCEYIKFLCADDKLHPHNLERFVRTLDENPNVSIVTSYSDGFGDNAGRVTPPFKGLVDGQLLRENMLAHDKNWLRNPSAVIFRKKDANVVGYFHPQLSYATDVEYYLRLLSRGDAYFVPESLSYTRSHPNTQTAQGVRKKYERIFESYAYFKLVKNTHPDFTESMRIVLDMNIKHRAVRSAAVMFELLPRLYKKANRQRFKKAFHIGRVEGVLLSPILKYLRWNYIKKLISSKQ